MKDVVIITFILFLAGCPFYHNERLEIPTAVKSMNNINTKYDDYNSMAPPPDDVKFYFIYSTNRYTRGGIYRVGEGKIEVTLKKRRLLLQIEKKVIITNEYIGQYNFPCKVTAGGDVLGPAMFSRWLPYNFAGSPYEDIPYPGDTSQDTYNSFFYSNYKSIFSEDMVYFYTSETTRGDFDIFYCTRKDPFPKKAGFNSSYNEKYIFIDDSGFIYFSSDRDGKFNIYEIHLPSGSKYYGGSTTSPIDLYYWLENYSNKITPEIISNINSPDADDTCPYVIWNTMFFASNRKGGGGGYDLYYSNRNYETKIWSKPKHLPYPINTEADEFRPSVYKIYGYKNYLMFFSSNRRGGRGGFDLYYVGVDTSDETY